MLQNKTLLEGSENTLCESTITLLINNGTLTATFDSVRRNHTERKDMILYKIVGVIIGNYENNQSHIYQIAQGL